MISLDNKQSVKSNVDLDKNPTKPWDVGKYVPSRRMRVWDQLQERMLAGNDLGFISWQFKIDGSLDNQMQNDDENRSNSAKLVPMFSTGVFDRNGIEIFELDIVRYKPIETVQLQYETSISGTYLVTWRFGGYGLTDEGNFQRPFSFLPSVSSLHSTQDALEVIGNALANTGLRRQLGSFRGE